MLTGAAYNASILIVVAGVMDYIFFGLIRDAMEELYHPTTFYGYGFLVALPFIEMIFKRHFERQEVKTRKKDFIRMIYLGLIALFLVILLTIVNFD